MPKLVACVAYQGVVYFQPRHVVSVAETGSTTCQVFTVDGTKWDLDEPAVDITNRFNERLMTR